ncbi:uncharacterized protein F5147DRAFT_196963 [Suillus discolor]|uniref:DUF6533 domain-containing protein n=1 Tax=Suillus discolor TaxID=1912936 RepID=A0A9P7K064_9AGAM|nr:uncharacterized protein F5147DRAFT_196963 [Suillus discolor]KAG2119078.1 hypothetical protein F5147DRAFT_196963 [Suillus discolor]
MPLIPSDPTSWSFNTDTTYRVSNYFIVASSAAVVYDWVLTFGREYELIWRQRRSLMTVLYIIVRYIGLPYSVGNVLLNLPGVLKTDTVSNVMNFALFWTIFIVNSMLSVIMITRLHAMYQRSRKMLIFLVVVHSSIMVPCAVIGAIGSNHAPTRVILLDGIQCIIEVDKGEQLWLLEVYILATAWHLLTLCLAIWNFVKHFRELQPLSTGRTFIGDCSMVLMKTHVLYFAFFTTGCGLSIGLLSPVVLDVSRLEAQIYRGILELVTLFQMFVVGPRLILSVRECHAEFLVQSEEGIFELPAIASQDPLQVPTSTNV